VNLALWLHRAGLSHGDRPALGLGTRVIRNYGEVAGRAARLATALRERFGLQPGERVAIAAKNCPDYVELMFGIWHAGLAAVPANAKLHGRELGYILQHSGARVCFASDGLDAEIAPHAPPTLERLIVIGSRDYDALFATDPIAPWPCDGDGLAWLFYTSGTTGRPKGAMLTHRVLAAASFAYAAEVNPIATGSPLLHAAPMSHGSGLYMMAHVARLGVNVVPESSGFEADEVMQLIDAWPGTSMFAAPTMVKRLVECAMSCNPDRIRTIIWGGAPMYVADALDAIDRFGPRFAQIYGQGESPMTITTLSKQEIADRDHPRWAERLGSAGRPFGCLEVMIADGDDRALRRGDAGLLGQPRSVGGDLARRLAAYRRRRRVRRRRLSDIEGPLQGRHHFRRLQYLSARGRGNTARARERPRGVGDRSARSAMGRGCRRLCGRRGRPRRARCVVPQRHRAVQTAEGLRVRERAAEK
jgi:long-chain acyl-CoA synthetase